MNKRFGFTLAEVLITLVIIGVIAAMTVPTLLNNTNSQEYRTGLKKAISALNQAVTMQYALDGTTVSDFSGNVTNVKNSVFGQRLSIIKSQDAAMADLGTGTGVFYTADGMRFAIASGSAAYTCLADGTTPCYDIVIDVNGDKKPNKQTTDVTKPQDQYTAQIYAQRVVPGNAITQGVMYDSK